eukprot:GFUD01023831.1.p1 GENE.GFUD01023831.1~~GFUD01023831.1.p1  ORF type:complete len:820 (-),score=227.95 GFUD01023831.1:113-2572(-)
MFGATRCLMRTKNTLSYCKLSDFIIVQNCRLISTSDKHNRKKKDSDRNPVKSTGGLRQNIVQTIGSSGGKEPKEPMSVFKPVLVKSNPDDLNFGEEIAGKINKQALLKELNRFFTSPEIKILCKDHGLDEYLYNQAYSSFRRFCMDVHHLPTELYILFSDILCGAQHNHDIFPYFLTHARKVFPHLDCIDELKLISDLTNPPNWYPEARAINRKIIFHSGPTNSGKTYHALERFLSAKSGIYCGPLKLLAVEVFNKSNSRGTPCDLVTGEERRSGREDGEISEHVACTVEMANMGQPFEVCVIDEIQVIKDFQRGWAWTRALLGIQAQEIHVCGEGAAVDLVKEICISTGEEVEVRNYKRLTPLVVQTTAVGTVDNIQAGDCIVCFNKQDIYNISRQLEQRGVEVAVIYGSLPPNTKLAMAAKFNDPNDSCKVMVATDAVGMGLNLNIRRMIFYSINKIQLTQDGEKEVDMISVSQSLQIAGRAGRFGTSWETGYVTTFKQEELKPLQDLLKQSPDEILQAGLHPTFDQLELYSYHLPFATLANLVDIFISLSTLDDSMYSLCHLDDFKFLADMIEHVRLPLKAKYTFCCAPINRKMPLVCTMFLKMARQYSKGELITFDWLCSQVGWPFSPPDTILDLVHLESVHDVFDLYLWLSYRFPDVFTCVDIVRQVQTELDTVIEEGVNNIVSLLKNADGGPGSSRSSEIDEDALEAKRRQIKKLKNSWTHEDANMAKKESGGVQATAKEKNSLQKQFQEASSSDPPIDYSSKRVEDNETEIVPSNNSKKSPGRLADQLLQQGIVTPKMMKQLKRELQDTKKR